MELEGVVIEEGNYFEIPPLNGQNKFWRKWGQTEIDDFSKLLNILLIGVSWEIRIQDTTCHCGMNSRGKPGILCDMRLIQVYKCISISTEDWVIFGGNK